MTHLTLEARESIVTKALKRTGKTLRQIAEENNIGYSTLSKWLRQARQGIALEPVRRGRPPKGLSQTPPLQHLLSTAKLDETGIGVYCREQGIHSFQLKTWREELMTHGGDKKQSDKEKRELKALRDEVKRLKKDLHRKDKALAETAALLVLKKKADLIWGEPEDD